MRLSASPAACDDGNLQVAANDLFAGFLHTYDFFALASHHA
jgi:hypothetical protein